MPNSARIGKGISQLMGKGDNILESQIDRDQSSNVEYAVQGQLSAPSISRSHHSN